MKQTGGEVEELSRAIEEADAIVVGAGAGLSAAAGYDEYLKAHSCGKVLYLDLGSGMNTPAIFKYPFMRMAWANPDAAYATVNLGEAVTAREIVDGSICVDGGLDVVVSRLSEMRR